MTLQIIDNLWELRIDNDFDANIQSHFLGSFTNNYLIAKVTSEFALPAWQQAGTLGQAVNFETSLAYGEFKPLSLDSHILLNFPLLTGASYDLHYFPLPRLTTVKLQIWEYQGTTENIEINKLLSALNNFQFPALEKVISQASNTSIKSATEQQEKDSAARQNLRFLYFVL